MCFLTSRLTIKNAHFSKKNIWLYCPNNDKFGMAETYYNIIFYNVIICLMDEAEYSVY